MVRPLSRLFARLFRADRPRADVPAYSVHPAGVTFLTEVSAAGWVEDGFSSRFATMGALVPDGFEAYARVLHLARDGSDRPVNWSTVAHWAGRVYHPLMAFEGISAPAAGHGIGSPPWSEDPNHGSLDEEVVAELLPFLAQFTGTPEQCYFGVWEGYGQYSGGTTMLTSDGSGRPLPPPRDVRSAQRIRGCGRNYLLYTGELKDITGFYANFGSEPPNIWWPADRAWFVSTDIDLDSTYVGARQECIDALLSHPALEAMPAEYRAAVHMEADTANLGDPI